MRAFLGSESSMAFFLHLGQIAPMGVQGLDDLVRYAHRARSFVDDDVGHGAQRWGCRRAGPYRPRPGSRWASGPVPELVDLLLKFRAESDSMRMPGRKFRSMMVDWGQEVTAI